MARLSAAATLEIESFSGGAIQTKISGMINGIIESRNGQPIVCQRPSINIAEDASASVVDVIGRGIYYWDQVDAIYFVNDEVVYKGSYSGNLAATLGTGNHQRVQMFEVGDYLVLIDSEDNKGYYIDVATSTTLTEIADLDFPPKQIPALTLAKGGAVLNGAGYVLTTDGDIYGSDSEDPTSWNGLNFRNAEVEPDKGVFLDKHQDHIAVFGTRTIEFFFDNANATGSPLEPRQDIFYNVGAVDEDSFWTGRDGLYFIGITPDGEVGAYRLSNFQLTKVSTPTIDTFLTSAIITDSVQVVGSGFSSGGHTIYVITLYNFTSERVPEVTLFYDSSNNTWPGTLELAYSNIDHAPIVHWTKQTTTRAGEGILNNGDLITIVDDKNPQDSVEAQIYVDDDYVEPGYISDTGAEGDNIELEIITGNFDAGTRSEKFEDSLQIVVTPTDSSQTITVQHSDEGNDNYDTGRTIDISSPHNRLNRLGSYIQRNRKLSYSGDEHIEIEGLQVEIDGES